MNRPIDFVLYWVDGNDPEHAQKRWHYQSSFSVTDERNTEQSVGNQRFVQHDELKFCLRSIKHFAPWYRHIHIITDAQIPAFLDADKMSLDRIKIIDHRRLFHKVPEYLPTFNSRALTTQLANLDEISDFFVLGNDDIMLSAPVSPEFFFRAEQPVLYADKALLSEVEGKTLYHQGIVNAARLVNPAADTVYLPSHGFMGLDKPRLKALEQNYPSAFETNLKYKFRHESQYLIECLYMHQCITDKQCVLFDSELMVHFSFELCRIGKADKIHFLFDLLAQGKRKMFCLNDFEALLNRLPEIKERLDLVCGPRLQCERPH